MGLKMKAQERTDLGGSYPGGSKLGSQVMHYGGDGMYLLYTSRV